MKSQLAATSSRIPCMKKPIEHFRDYVKGVGGRTEAGKRLGFSAGQVGHILCGRRGITAQVAMKIDADTDGAISKESLRPDLWGKSAGGSK